MCHRRRSRWQRRLTTLVVLHVVDTIEEVSNIVLNLIFRSEPLRARLNRFSAVFAYRIVLICRATPALQMWRACSTPAPASNKFCIFTKDLHLSEVHRRSELSHLSEVRSRQSTTSNNIILLLRSSKFCFEAYYRPRDCDMSQESQLLLDEQFRGTNVITLRSPIMNSRTSSLSGTHVMTL